MRQIDGEKIMSRKKGQTYTSEQKTKIVLELLREESTVAQLASKYKVSAQTLNNWKRQFLSNASLAFEPAKALQEYKEHIQSKDKEIEELQKQLGKSVIEKEWLAKKLKSLDLSSKKSLVNSKLSTLSLTRQCALLGISRSAYYYTPSPMSAQALAIMHSIDEIATDNSEYGYRLIHQQLLEDGHHIGKNRVLKYMRILGIQAIYPTKRKLTSIGIKEHHKYPYLLTQYHNSKKQVAVEHPNEVWSGDITYIRMNGGFMYLCAIIDWHTKAILAYKLSNTMDATLTTEVLQEALRQYPKPKLFNSDQGSQYTSHEHTALLKNHNIAISMNGKGRSIDNIAIERFFRTLKHSNIYISDYRSIQELKEGVKAYIEKYNFRRFHSSIGYKKPMHVYLEALEKAA